MRQVLTAVCLSLLAPVAATRAADVSATVGKDGIEFRSGGSVVARYVTDSKYARPFLYPVLAPAGVPVTRGWPVATGVPGEVTRDHVHHKSVWFCHGDVIPEGLTLRTRSANKNDAGVDFWSEATDKTGKRLHGRIVVVRTGEPQAAAGSVAVETHNEWLSADDEKILDEVRVLTFRELPAGRLFVFDITLKATTYPITFGDTKEGSFGIRVHDALRLVEKDGGTITTAEGRVVPPPARDNLPIWGQPAAWVDYSGRVEGRAVGIAVFDHPRNPPAHWHVRAYGLNAANPFGRNHSGFPAVKGQTDRVRIPKGGELRLRYGVYAHDGDVKTGRVAEAYETFCK